MTSSADFQDTVRRGRRFGRPTMVLHVRHVATDPSVRIGFVVSKSVGNAVMRNRVKRRLRHLAAAELSDQAEPESSRVQLAGSRIVVRALPAAAQQPDRLPTDFRRAWDQATARAFR